MGNQRQSSRSLVKSLRRKQVKHEVLLERVEKTSVRLERRKAKLLALEGKIADLERRVTEPRTGRSVQAASGEPLQEAVLIFNPSAGPDPKDGAARLEATVSALRAHGIEASVGLKTSGKALREQAREAARSRVPLVIAAGGDGTVEAIAAQLVGSRTALGIIPLGTMNNVARSLGVPLDMDEACALIGMGTMRNIDVGRVFSNEPPQVDYFLEGAGVGLSAIAALAGEGIEKRRWHLLPRALHKFFESKPGMVRIAMDDAVVETCSHMVTASNAPMMGNNLMIAPDAKMDDGFLDVVVYDGMGEAALFKHFIAASGKSPNKLRTYRTRYVRITATEPLPSNTDGDVAPQSRVIEIEIAPRALTVVAGNGLGLSVPVEAAPGAMHTRGTAPHVNGNGDKHRVEPEAARL